MFAAADSNGSQAVPLDDADGWPDLKERANFRSSPALAHTDQ